MEPFKHQLWKRDINSLNLEVGSGERWVGGDLRQQAAGAMASDLDFSPPEVPEPTFLENLLRYGLFLGAIFQLICVLAIIIPVPKSHEAVSPSLWASAPQAGFWVLKITDFTALKTSRDYAGLDWFKVSPNSHLVALGHVVHTLFVCMCEKQIFI